MSEQSWANTSDWCYLCDPVEERWTLVRDMNRDGMFTITDVLHWVGYVFHVPGDGFFYLLMKGFPSLTAFLEVTAVSYGGYASGIISVFVWLIAWVVFAVIEATT